MEITQEVRIKRGHIAMMQKRYMEDLAQPQKLRLRMFLDVQDNTEPTPEMLRITELPSQVHYKTSYFSLGCLLLYALTGGSEDF